MAKEKFQWHPAFMAAMQIDFGEEAEHLLFLSEHELNRMPMRIDGLVIKKIGKYPLKKSIGRILRGHNIFEYKNPLDSLTIDDFYKVYGYTCFYKSANKHVDKIEADDVTITFVCNRYPKKMLRKLKQQRNMTVHKVNPGIYYLEGDAIPMQLLLTKELSAKENLWLKSLRTGLTKEDYLEKLIQDFDAHRESNLYQAAMYLIAKANREAIKEVRDMQDALREVFKEDYDKVREENTKEVTKEVTNRNILAFIEVFLEEGFSETAICEKLQKVFNLSPENAKRYF